MKTLRAVLLVSTFLLALPGLGQAVYTTGFEAPEFAAGDVDGQNGWGHLSNSPTGGTIESTPAGSPAMFGAQSLAVRTRNADFFGVANHLHSAVIDPPAGENGSTAGGVAVPDPQSHFSATLWVRTPDAPVISTRPDGRFAELNPSSKGPDPDAPANRYAQVRLFNSTNDAAGAVRVEIGWYTSAAFTVATVAMLDWGTWYRFDYLIHLVDGTDGLEPNDRFTLTIFDLDGVPVGSACGSTWELGWKSGTFGGGTTARAIDGFDFWSTSGPNGTLAVHLDELTMTAFTPAGVLQVAIAGNAQACLGGTTLLTADAAAGGAAVTAYEWRNAANEVAGTAATLDAGPGTYTVTVTDALCVTATSAPFEVTGSAALAVTISGASSIPAGTTTTLTANVTGGSGAIAGYTWRDALSNVAGTGATLDAGPGTYTVTVEDASCGTAASDAFVVAAVATAAIPTAGTMGLMVMLATLAALALVRLR